MCKRESTRKQPTKWIPADAGMTDQNQGIGGTSYPIGYCYDLNLFSSKEDTIAQKWGTRKAKVPPLHKFYVKQKQPE